jgi:drug/metabolite transporter (DMT)-like permease
LDSKVNVPGTVVAALGAACCFAIAAVLQQLAARTVPREDSMQFGLLLRLLRRPLWLLGAASMLAGYGLQALALSLGPVALVQPIVVTELAFAIPLAMWLDRKRPGVREWLGLGGVVVGVSTFLLGATPAPGTSDPTFTVWLLVLVPIGSLVAVVLVAAARTKGPRRSVLLGAAAGLCFGVIAVLTKATTFLLAQGLNVAAGHWEPYVLIAVGILALVCSQSAYQSGPIAYSMPLHDLLEPTVAVVIGIAALHERIPLDPRSLAIIGIGAAMACAGIVTLSRSPVVHGEYLEHEHDEPVVLLNSRPLGLPVSRRSHSDEGRSRAASGDNSSSSV